MKTVKKIGRPVGSKKAIPPQVSAEVGKMNCPADLKLLLRRLANHCIKGEISTLQTSALNGLLMTWCKIYEMDDIARRLDKIERKIDKSFGKKTRTF